jgi:hypothetical protein
MRFDGFVFACWRHTFFARARPGVYRVAGFERTRFPMPAYSHLGADQLDALVHLLMQQPAYPGEQR